MLRRASNPTAASGVRAGGLDTVRIGTGRAGLVIGEDMHGQPVGIQLFGPKPTGILVVGRLRLAQIIGFRALAIGARIYVQSSDPAKWNALAAHASEMEANPRASFVDWLNRPNLTITDATSAGAVSFGVTPKASLSSVLLIKNDFIAADAAIFHEADVTLLQPLPPAQAELLASAMNLPSDQASYFSQIGPDVVTIVSRGEINWVRLAVTSIERYVIGDPTEHG